MLFLLTASMSVLCFLTCIEEILKKEMWEVAVVFGFAFYFLSLLMLAVFIGRAVEACLEDFAKKFDLTYKVD
jgi:hypothetical protein